MSDLMKAVEECKLSKGWDGMPYKLHQNIDLLFAECSKSATKIKQLQKENADLKANNAINEIEKRLSKAERLLASLKRDFYR